MAIVRIPLLFLARLVLEVLRDLTEALGRMLHALGRAVLRLLGAAALAVIAYAAFLRVVVDVWLPPVVWLALAGAALAATLAWLLGWCLVCLAHPGRLVGPLTDPGRQDGVSERRIAEWDAAWRRTLLYQQRQQAAGGERKTSNGQRARAVAWRASRVAVRHPRGRARRNAGADQGRLPAACDAPAPGPQPRVRARGDPAVQRDPGRLRAAVRPRVASPTPAEGLKTLSGVRLVGAELARATEAVASCLSRSREPLRTALSMSGEQ